MAPSTLELLLDSIKDRDEGPSDALPPLPQRPPSKARLPSSALRTKKVQPGITAAAAIVTSIHHADSKENNAYTFQSSVESSARTFEAQGLLRRMATQQEATLKSKEHEDGEETAASLTGEDDATSFSAARFRAEGSSRGRAGQQGARDKSEEHEEEEEIVALVEGEAGVTSAGTQVCKPGRDEQDILIGRRKRKRVDCIGNLRKVQTI